MMREVYSLYEGHEVALAIKQIRAELQLASDQQETRAQIAKLMARLDNLENNNELPNKD